MLDISFEKHSFLKTLKRLTIRIAPYLVMAIVFLVPSTLQNTTQGQARITSVAISNASLSWSPVNLRNLKLPSNEGLLRVSFSLPLQLAEDGEPLAVYLSGLFSAQAYWNGVAIGAKGKPASEITDEKPGPIDAVFPIPANLVRPGHNVLTLKMSSHGVTLGAHSIIHSINGSPGISVSPYIANWHRPLGYYGTPFLMIGFLSALFPLILRNKRLIEENWTILVVLAILVGAIAEVSRAFINYPYPWHVMRLSVLLLAGAAAGLGIMQASAERSGIILKGSVLLALSVTVFVGMFLINSFDERVAFLFGSGAFIGTLLAFIGAIHGRKDCMELLFVLGLISFFAFFFSQLFLDRLLYAAALPLTAILLRRRSVDNIKVEDERVSVGAGRDVRSILISEIKAIHGAGNYSEIELCDGTLMLDQTSLAEWDKRLPPTFSRTHRSHIVRLDMVVFVRILGGGKYETEFLDGARLPLSRKFAAAVKRKIAQQTELTKTGDETNA